jgi:hypothetical protein
VTESTSTLALRVRESTSPLAMRVRGLFSPLSLPGLAAWYDASDSSTVLTTVSPDVPATDGQTVRRWLDKSGAGRHLNQETLANQMRFVTNAQNGRGMVDTNSTAGPFMSTATFTALTQPLTVYIVASRTGSASSFFDGDSTNSLRFRRTAPQFVLSCGSSLTPSIGITHDDNYDGRRGLYFAVANGANSVHQARLSVYQRTVSGDAGISTVSAFNVPAQTNGTNATQAEIFELLVYQAAHGSTQIERLAKYFADRWALAHIAIPPV